jgi:hypothetical protein
LFGRTLNFAVETNIRRKFVSIRVVELSYLAAAARLVSPGVGKDLVSRGC